jgi:hypothetical protein
MKKIFVIISAILTGTIGLSVFSVVDASAQAMN